MLPLETKQSAGKILQQSDLRRGVFVEEASRTRQRKGDVLLGKRSVKELYRVGSLTAAAREVARYNWT